MNSTKLARDTLIEVNSPSLFVSEQRDSGDAQLLKKLFLLLEFGWFVA